MYFHTFKVYILGFIKFITQKIKTWFLKNMDEIWKGPELFGKIKVNSEDMYNGKEIPVYLTKQSVIYNIHILDMPTLPRQWCRWR